MIDKFLSLFRKKKVQPLSFTTDTVDVGLESKELVFRKLRKKKQLTHTEINLLSHMYFDVTFKNTYYRFRNSGNYGQYFQIKDFQLVMDLSNTDLVDIIMVLHDAAFETSLKILISVKEINETMENFVPDFNFTKPL